MQKELMELSSEFGIDFSFQTDDMYRRMRRLICFDMDSTLIQTECIDELAKRNGVGDKVAEITARAMRGEIDFKESFTQRVALLKGLDVAVMKDIAENLPITEGTDRLMSVLKKCGYKIAILSGGFTYFGEHLQRKYNIDYVYANELEIGEDGKLTGRYVGEIVDGTRKAELLRLIAQVEKINLAHNSGGRRGKRFAYDLGSRIGNSLPRKTKSDSQCPASHKQHRTRRGVIFSRLQGQLPRRIGKTLTRPKNTKTKNLRQMCRRFFV